MSSKTKTIMGYRITSHQENNKVGRCGKGKKIKYVQTIEWKDEYGQFHRRTIIHKNNP